MIRSHFGIHGSAEPCDDSHAAGCVKVHVRTQGLPTAANEVDEHRTMELRSKEGSAQQLA